MSALATYGAKVPYGAGIQLPIAAFPKGRAKIRMRNNDFVKVFIKTENGIRAFYPEEMNGVWIPKYEIGSNHREVIS
jgi:hypothetical protein